MRSAADTASVFLRLMALGANVRVSKLALSVNPSEKKETGSSSEAVDSLSSFSSSPPLAAFSRFSKSATIFSTRRFLSFCAGDKNLAFSRETNSNSNFSRFSLFSLASHMFFLRSFSSASRSARVFFTPCLRERSGLDMLYLFFLRGFRAWVGGGGGVGFGWFGFVSGRGHSPPPAAVTAPRARGRALPPSAKNHFPLPPSNQEKHRNTNASPDGVPLLRGKNPSCGNLLPLRPLRAKVPPAL
ncbi:hypothetical protein AGDE_14196 [Angomonas deanei]|nr:hypothetical protein AGDE_14196 [Angomonas deanei]|eukprot:EPY21193.1 hypothetical protein AGDE_14196 [Angomonas deanei]